MAKQDLIKSALLKGPNNIDWTNAYMHKLDGAYFVEVSRTYCGGVNLEFIPDSISIDAAVEYLMDCNALD